MINKKIYWPKFIERKFILMTALFVMAQVYKYQEKISDAVWVVASGIGIFGLVVIKLWFKQKDE